MTTRKTRISMALGAVIAAGAIAPAKAFGYSICTIGRTGPCISASDIVTASGGDTLLFPIYTTARNATTSFSVTNTSNEQTVLAKIRFREQTQSMDVLDFYAILSPSDKFDFWVERPNGDARPSMGWSDNTCVVGPSGDRVMFPEPSPFVAFGSDEPEVDMQLGHLEVLGVANLDGSGSPICVDSSGAWAGCGDSGAIDLADAALHDSSGVPANCNILVTTFASPSNANSINQAISGSGEAYDVDNILVGRYVITGAGEGIEGGGDAIAIRDTDYGRGLGDLRIPAQSSASCDRNGNGTLDPDENCASNYAWDAAEWDHPHLAEMFNFWGFQNALTATSVSGDWSNNFDNAVGVDWVLSFPSKYAYLDWVDLDDCNASGTAKTWCLLEDIKTNPGVGTAGAWTASSTTDLCINDNSLRVFDTEEGEASGNVNVSPGSRTTLDICEEMQVFTLAAEGDTPRESVIQYSDRRSVVEFLNLPAQRGWAELGLSWPSPQIGGAVSGIIFTTRATEDPTVNNGSITGLQKFAPPQQPNGG
jgi:hypothetical protein